MSQTPFTPPPTTASLSGGNPDYKPYLIPEKTHAARCVWFIKIGTFPDVFNEGKKKTKCLIGFELPNCRLPEDHPRKGEPAFISKEFTLSMGDKSSLRPFVNDWRGKELTDDEASKYDFSKIVGQPAAIEISHKAGATDPSRVYSNIKSIKSEKKYAAIVKEDYKADFSVPAQVNKSVYLSVDWLTTPEGAEYFMGIFNDLPKYTRELIMKSDEWQVYTRQPFYIQPAVDATAQPHAPAGNPAPQNAGALPMPQAPANAEPRAEDVIDDNDLPF